ncbi:MAG: hypothetical protein ABFR32_11535 [Bacteroidota bacterium]
MKQKIILFLLLLYSINGFACMNTYQFKIFPIGVYNDYIVTIDVKIYRTSIYEGNRKYDLNFKSKDTLGMDEMWIIETYHSVYNKNQKLISTTALDIVYSTKSDYTKDLQKTYVTGFEKILMSYKELKLFKPDFLSFCDYKKKCRIIEAKKDTIKDNDIIVYKETNYPVTITQDEKYYGFNNSPYFTKNSLSSYSISSTRIYRTNKIEIIIGHFGTGHELSMGWITDDPEKKPKDESDIVILAKEHIPEIKFDEIKTSVYKEPLLHHGFGYDIFIINEQ